MNLKHILYATLIAGFALTSCSDDDDDYGVLDGLDMVTRSASIEDGASVRLNGRQTLVINYNNLVALREGAGSVTVNDQPANASADGMNLLVDLDLQPYTTYTIKVPAGLVAIKDKQNVTAPEWSMSFNTNLGTNPAAVDKNLTDAAANEAAKKVYNFLLANYGRKTLSGAMASEAVNTGYTDFLAAETGKKPAVIGFDFIHLAYSPANWVDYTNNPNVIGAWNDGSIPAFTWHWNMPKTQSSESDITTYGSKIEETDFDIEKALTPGTWEHNRINKDIEKVAGYLKQYQDAGVAILWRPLHEAAGDYGWGPWFWWGAKGVEKTKQLWIYLHDQLTQTYGIHNLIWVWTVQTSNAGVTTTPEEMRAAYPGDEYCDMIGVDIYPTAVGSSQTALFDVLNSMVEGKKMIALSEVGLFPDFDLASGENALWSYFLQWYDFQSDGKPGVNIYNTVDTWKSVFSAPYVLNQGDLKF